MVVASTLLAGCELLPDAPVFAVTTTVDGVDADPGDGVCEMTPGEGDCSLRAAVDEANRSVEIAIVTVPSDTYPLTLAGVDDDNAAGDLDLFPAAGAVFIEPGTTQGFAVDASAVEGGLDLHSGRLVAFGVGVRGAGGDGVHVRNGAAGAFTFASFHGSSGAGVRIDDGGRGQLWVATVSGNGSGGIANQGVLTARFLTVSANTRGGITGRGDDDAAHSVTLDSSLVSRQTSGRDCTDGVITAIATTSSDGSCWIQGGDGANTTVAAPMLEPLSGGLLPYHALTYPGPAGSVRDSIPIGYASCIPGSAIMVDQRGVARPQGGACDRGASEGPVSISLVVDSAADERDVAPGDGVCATASGTCALRAAIDEANAWPAPDTIQIASGVDPSLTRAGPNEDANSTGDLDVLDSLTITGAGNVIDAGGLDRVVDHRPGAGQLRLHGLDLVGGDASGARGDGGALRSNPALELVDVTIAGARGIETGAVLHTATSAGLTMRDVSVIGAVGSVAGIRADIVDLDRVVVDGTVGGAGIVVNRGRIDESQATDNDSGGLRTFPANLAVAELAVTNSTFAGNRAPAVGAGVRAGLGTWITLTRSTVSGNQAADGSGVWSDLYGKVDIVESTIVANGGASSLGGAGARPLKRSAVGASSGVLCATPASSLDDNVTTDTSCAVPAANDRVVADLLLSPLADNGGPTLTHAPLPGSPLVDVVPTSPASDSSQRCRPGRVDQRGVAIPQAFGCDAGAVEAEAVSLGTVVVTTSADGLDDDAGDGVCFASAAGGCTLRAAIEESNRSAVVETIVIGAGVDPVLGIAGRDEDANLTGDIDITAPVMLVGSGSTVSGSGLDRVLDARAVVGPLVIIGVAIVDGDAGGTPGAGPGGLAAAGHLTLDSVDFRGNVGTGVGALGIVVADDGLAGTSESERTRLRAVTASGNQGGPAIAVTGGDTDIADSELADNRGGGLDFVGQALTVRGSTVRGNTAPEGAGIHGLATLVDVDQSWIAGNRATGDGGGMHITGGMSLKRTTVSGNEAGGAGGGVWKVGGATTALVQATTISGNRATDASGLQIGGSALIQTSTIVRNEGGASVAVSNVAGSTIGMSVIDAGSGTACASAFGGVGYNLFGDATCGGGPTDRTGLELFLGPLQDNGGPTPTHQPLAGAPSVDAVPLSATIPSAIGPVRICSFFGFGQDQRGVARPQGPACDIGAFER